MRSIYLIALILSLSFQAFSQEKVTIINSETVHKNYSFYNNKINQNGNMSSKLYYTVENQPSVLLNKKTYDSYLI